MADGTGIVGFAEEVGPSQKEEEMGVEAQNDDKDNGSWDKLEDAGKVKRRGEGAVSAPKPKSTQTKGNGVDGE